MNKKTLGSFVSLLLIAGLLASCTPGQPEPSPAPTPFTGSTGPGVVYVVQTPAKSPGLAAYVPVPVSVNATLPATQIALADVTNPEIIAGLSAERRALLEQNGFLVIAYGPQQIYDFYKSAKERGDPIYVTTDSVLHTFHILYDYALRLAEAGYFIPDLEKLNAAMLDAALEQYAQGEGPVKEAARLNLAYFSVATRLLAPEAETPADVEDLVRAELALIEAHAGFQKSPITGNLLDYSRFVPRGHYTRSEALQRYFKAMSWYGLVEFRLKPGKTPESIAIGRRETRQALLMSLALGADPEALARWDRIYEPTAFFVGKADDLTVYDYLAVVKDTLGEQVSLGNLTDDAKIDAFIAGTDRLPAPKISSSFVLDTEKPEEVTKGFRLMGQRFVPDSYMLQQLVYNQVGTPDDPRLFPKGLDVFAVLGSDRATDILKGVYHEDRFANYDTQIAKLQAEFGELTTDDWTQNLYYGWLYALLPLLESKGDGYPTYMRNQAWTDKQLYTTLGSWTELRHDTILYAKQSTTVRATGMPPQQEKVVGYVEPEVGCYARLAALTQQMRAGLGDRGLLGDEMAVKFESLEKLLLALKTIAEKELAGQPLTETEENAILYIGGTLENITTFTSQAADEVSSEADKRMAIVADVHTDTNSQSVLEEGVGDAFTIYVVIERGGYQTVCVGATFSQYEFTWPMDNRLTDEAWQALEQWPARAEWTTSFVR
ncbi:MAG: DUF3160 domain-containing protein [Chloroflexi bacterium]|nr:DUF3160 domain-containing protein [Chloroflexota bacterium]